MKPIDKAIFGMVSESPGQNMSEPTGGLDKKTRLQRPSPLFRGEGSMDRRRLTGAASRLFSVLNPDPRASRRERFAAIQGFPAWHAKSSGRKKVTRELRKLIFQMVAENPSWGAPRIHGELLKLGFDVSEREIQALDEKQAGKPIAGNRHDGFEVAGTGNQFTVQILRHSQRNGEQPLG